MNNLVIITPFTTISTDERGVTAEFFLPRKQADFIYITRKADSMSGNTYHEGKLSATNPKILILLQGEISFLYRSIESNEKNEIHIKSPTKIEIQPKVTHAVKALTDIVMLECNSLTDLQGDRFREIV